MGKREEKEMVIFDKSFIIICSSLPSRLKAQERYQKYQAWYVFFQIVLFAVLLFQFILISH